MAKGYSTANTEVISIEIAKIIQIPGPVRPCPADSQRAKDKKDQLRAQGQLAPVTVLDNNDGTYTLVDGLGRMVGATLVYASGESIPGLEDGFLNAIVIGNRNDFSDNDIIKLQLGANFHEQTGAKEAVEAMVRLASDGMSLTEIGEELGCSASTVSMWLKTVRLPDTTRELLAKGEITLSNALVLQGLHKKLDEETYASVVNSAKSLQKSDLEKLVKAEVKKVSSLDQPDPVFTPVPKFVGVEKLTQMYSDALAAGSRDARVLAALLSLDEEGIAAQKAIFDEAAEKRAKAKAKEAEAKTKKVEKLRAELAALEA